MGVMDLPQVLGAELLSMGLLTKSLVQGEEPVVLAMVRGQGEEPVKA